MKPGRRGEECLEHRAARPRRGEPRAEKLPVRQPRRFRHRSVGGPSEADQAEAWHMPSRHSARRRRRERPARWPPAHATSSRGHSRASGHNPPHKNTLAQSITSRTTTNRSRQNAANGTHPRRQPTRLDHTDQAQSGSLRLPRKRIRSTRIVRGPQERGWPSRVSVTTRNRVAPRRAPIDVVPDGFVRHEVIGLYEHIPNSPLHAGMSGSGNVG